MKNKLIQLSKNLDTNIYYATRAVDLETLLEIVRLVSKHGGSEVLRATAECGAEVSDLFVQIVEKVRETMRTF
jgi:hypothetical protein